jgi:hypothetical protein
MALLCILIVIFDCFGSIFFFNIKKERPTDDVDEQELDHLLCKFVSDGSGRCIGESISIDKDILIIKSKEGFLGVPIKHIEDIGKTLVVKGLINLDKAYVMGEKWRQNSFCDLNDEEENKGEKDGF